MKRKYFGSVLKVLICIIALMSLFSILPIHGEEKIYDSVVRIHVLANSDSKEDQELKLKVRDALLEITSPVVSKCETREEAIEKLKLNFEKMQEEAQRVIKENGYSYPVKVGLSEEHYPTRKYEGFCFPQGVYASLKVEIGEAAGKNWWCVLFPPLCLSAASERKNDTLEDAFISVGLTEEQYKIITETDNVKYQARFKILEVFEKMFS